MEQRNGVPLLPGYRLPCIDKENFRTSQTLQVAGTTMLEKQPFTNAGPADPDLIASLRLSANTGAFNATRNCTGNRIAAAEEMLRTADALRSGYASCLPGVLRYFAYFTEPVADSQIEKTVLRRVTLLYYLEDGTLQIDEPKVRNSGIPQGAFLKRQKVFKDPSKPTEFLSPEDLVVGRTIKIFGRDFTIYGADESTRDAQGEGVAEAMVVPVDEFTRTAYRRQLRVNDPETKFFKEYVEAKNGGGNPNRGLEQYLTNDRQVLSFQAIWNDTAFAGDVNRYTLNYFLADDTVEVKELQAPNSGRHPFPLLLKKGKLPKRPVLVHCPGMAHAPPEFYKPCDLVLGKTVFIYGRECLLFDCDAFTRGYYKDKLGIDQVTLPLAAHNEVCATVRSDPPYNGFGSEQDSLGNCRHLIPRPPRPDMQKIFRFDGVTLRFICERLTGDPVDAKCNLILSFFMGDDSLSIYLTAGRNSGVLGGKFLERRKYKNRPRGDAYFEAGDFQLGAVLEVNSHRMRIISADDFTLRFMEAHPEWFPRFDVNALIHRLSAPASGDSPLERWLTAMRKTSPLIFREMADCARSAGVVAEPQELFALFVRAERDADGKVSADALAAAVQKTTA